MNTDIKDLGNQFREKRKEMHLSLKEVENATSIRMLYLQAIEEGDIGKYLSPVYALGFIKQYGNFLGFDGEKIIKDNPHAFNMKKKEETYDYGIGTIDIRNKNASSSKYSNIFWIGISLVLMVLAWYFAKFLKVI